MYCTCLRQRTCRQSGSWPRVGRRRPGRNSAATGTGGRGLEPLGLMAVKLRGLAPDGGALPLGQLAGDGPVDPLPDTHHVAPALVHEVEPPRLAALVDAVTTSGHQVSLLLVSALPGA
jgi:hypothetical protein